jgi:two-component sensor histidine kinase
LAPYIVGENMKISGAEVRLSAAETQAVAMVLHELVTNAAKYGALSTPGGQVSVSWDRRTNGHGVPNFLFVWRELGGPRVARDEVPPGYGTRLIRDLIPHELGGRVDLVFATDGVSCTIEIPLEQV